MPALRNVLLAASLVAAPVAASAEEPLKVVASFSILADIIGNIGGADVEITTLVGPDGDAHIFEPSPADASRVAGADLVVVNGLGFEGWFDRLVEASGFPGSVVVASMGIEPLHLGDGVDPHAWQSIRNARRYAANIAAALCEADADRCVRYRQRAAEYDAELAALDASIAAGFAALPEEERVVITSHDAFGYFGKAYGVRFLAPQGLSTEAEASAADLAGLIGQIRSEGVQAFFVENISDPRLIEQVARETGARPGGALYSDALSAPDGPAPTYAAMMRQNAERLLTAMQGS